jgi:hypothetical protein
VQGGRALLDSRFLLIAADERATGVSGCSIDTPVPAAGLARARARHHADRCVSRVVSRWRRRIVSVPRAEFRRLAADGEVTAETVVFDPTVASVGALRAGRFERRAGDSWHARLLPAAR